MKRGDTGCDPSFHEKVCCLSAVCPYRRDAEVQHEERVGRQQRKKQRAGDGSIMPEEQALHCSARTQYEGEKERERERGGGQEGMK